MKSSRATHDFVRFVNVNSPLCNGFHLQFNYSKLHIFVNLYLLSLLHFISYNVAGGRFMRRQEKLAARSIAAIRSNILQVR
jgi:hypothetical protein